jgi:hypothetical protein
MTQKRTSPRPSPRAPSSLDLPDLVGAWMVDCQMARSRRYLELGRRFGDQPIEALSAAWVETYRAARGVPEDPIREEDLQDLRCEFDLRGIKPPMHLVAAEAELFAKRFERQLRERPFDLEAAKEVEEMLERMRDRLQAPKH